MKQVRVIDVDSATSAESLLNKYLQEFTSQGYVAEILSLTPTANVEKIRWRFVILFTKIPGDESQQ